MTVRMGYATLLNGSSAGDTTEGLLKRSGRVR
jgi:hypothetical protein